MIKVWSGLIKFSSFVFRDTCQTRYNMSIIAIPKTHKTQEGKELKTIRGVTEGEIGSKKARFWRYVIYGRFLRLLLLTNHKINILNYGLYLV